MSNAASRASSAGRYFKEVQDAAADPSAMKLAQGLRALADAVQELAREQEHALYTIKSRLNT
jgi:hypothetical protein